jgi:ElaB/YqjD/DUF883 family membrane-anchored ribosome-binding protein
MENEDLIRKQMEETRTSLTEKLELIEEKLVNTVQETTSAVNETVTNVKETMHDTVASVKESMHEGVETVKDWVDIPAHVQERPWLMVGGSVLCGYLLGTLLTEKQSTPGYLPAPAPVPSPGRKSHASPYKAHQGNGGHNGGSRRQQPAAEESMASSLLNTFEPEINKLKGLAIGAALGTLREMITSEVPPQVGGQLREIIDGVTRKMGGEPIASVDWAHRASTPEATASNPETLGRSRWGSEN